MAGALDKQGIETTVVSAGQFKSEGNPFEKLTPQAKAAMQKLVDSAYATFLSDVAKGRRATVADVRTGYGQGRLLDAESALRAGMVDRIETFEATIARLQASGSAGPLRAASLSKNGMGAPTVSQSIASSSLAAKRVALDLRAKRFALAQRTLR
jgi:ClpP class serine protease